MIDPKQFYEPSDEPSDAARRRMWRAIESRVGSASSPWLVLERRSFVFGMAASVVVLLAGLGAYHAVERLLERGRPAAVRVDQAYQAAIREFEILATRSTVEVTADVTGSVEPRQELFRSRQEQLRSVDAAISTLREELRAGDLSPVKRARLRDLYAKKLVVLQQMIEQGEIAL